jgi:MFS family permease
MLSAPLITHLARSFGIKPPMFAGAVIFGGGFIAASFASRVWHLLLSQGALVGLGVGFVYVPSIAVLSQWFARRRSLANGISAAGSGIGGLVFSFAAGALIDHLGIAWALRITGIIALLALLLAAAFIRDRNSIIQPRQHPFDMRLAWRADVLLLLSWAFLSMLGYIPLLYSLSDFSISIGLSRQQATQVTAFLNMGTAIGRPFIGVASDRFGRFGVATSLTLLCGLSCLVIWIPATSFGVTVFFAILSGAILGVFWMVRPLCPCNPELYLW